MKLYILILMVFLVGCASSNAPQPTHVIPTRTPITVATHIPTNTRTPIATNTQIPTNTTLPTITPTDIPTATVTNTPLPTVIEQIKSNVPDYDTNHDGKITCADFKGNKALAQKALAAGNKQLDKDKDGHACD